MANSALDSALELTKRGLYVVPVDRSVKPFIKGWTRDDSLSQMETVERLWSRFPDANVAISTGPSDVVVIDVDPRNGGDSTLANLQREHDSDFPRRTVTTITGGGGRHYYFAANGVKFPGGNAKLGPGIDVKASGGLAVAPRSIHANGNAYTWEPGYGIAEAEIAPIPDWLAQALAKKGASKSRSAQHVLGSVARQCIEPMELIQVGNIPYLYQLCAAPLDGGKLRALDRDACFVHAASTLLQIPADIRIGETFCCVLPGHVESKPSASLYPDRTGCVMYRDWHAGSHGTPEWLTLSEVFHAQVTGHIEKLTEAPTHATWKLRMLCTLGILPFADVPMIPCPLDASNAARGVYRSFRMLLGCKWHYQMGKETTFAWRFAADWGGSSVNTVQKGMHELLDRGIICRVGTHVGQFGKTLTTYLPA